MRRVRQWLLGASLHRLITRLAAFGRHAFFVVASLLVLLLLIILFSRTLREPHPKRHDAYAALIQHECGLNR